MSTADARPRPNILTITSSVETKATKTLIMISAAGDHPSRRCQTIDDAGYCHRSAGTPRALG